MIIEFAIRLFNFQSLLLHLLVFVAGDARGGMSPQAAVLAVVGTSQQSETFTSSNIDSGFSNPQAIVVDMSENIFVADEAGNVVKKIAPNGAVTTIASGLSQPYGIAVDSAGNVL